MAIIRRELEGEARAERMRKHLALKEYAKPGTMTKLPCFEADCPAPFKPVRVRCYTCGSEPGRDGAMRDDDLPMSALGAAFAEARARLGWG